VRSNRPATFRGSRSGLGAAAQGIRVLRVTGMRANIGFLPLCRSGLMPHLQAGNDQNQKNDDCDYAENEAHRAAARNETLRNIMASFNP
jgi:hypothetical protein